jgi:hypothetical protein
VAAVVEMVVLEVMAVIQINLQILEVELVVLPFQLLDLFV